MTHQTLLVTLSGADRPGVTSALFTELSAFDVRVDDIEQLVVRGRLVLSVLLGLNDDASTTSGIEAALLKVADHLGMELDTRIGPDEDRARRHGEVTVTVLGRPLRPAAIARVADEIRAKGGNIDRIHRIAKYPVTAVVLEVSAAEVGDLRRVLTVAGRESGVDIAVQTDGLDRRGQHLVVLDVDSTVIQEEVIDLLAAEAGVEPEVSAITERAMRGEIDFTQSLRERAALLAGLDADALSRIRERITLTPGARTLCRTLKTLGYRICLVSGGFIDVVQPLADELGVDAVRANRLEIVDGRLTGRIDGPVIDREGKRSALEQFATEFDIPMRRTIAIGDGANDIDMLQAAGLGVAFNAKSAARAAADAALNVPYLDTVLYLLGITREQVEAADSAAGVESRAPVID